MPRKTQRIQVLLDPDTLKRFRELSAADGRSMSGMARRLIEEAIEEWEGYHAEDN